MTSLPPIPDEAYNAGHETIGSAYEWGTSDEVIEAAYPHIAEAVLRWAADELEASAHKAIDRQQRLRSPKSKREADVQTRIGHGSAGIIGASRTVRALADEIKEARQ